MSPTDSLFLIPESREQPMHVGSLQLYEPPPGSGPDYLTDLYQRAISATAVKAQFRRRPYRGIATLGQWAWTVDDAIDLEHHVRHSALPRPGRVRELLALASRLHGTLLDRQRPLWEIHLIEGLADGRFAVYTKMHHAMMDGVSGLRLMARSLSTDPERRDMPLPFVEDDEPFERAHTEAENPVALAARGAASLVTSAVGLAPRLLRIAESGLRDEATALPMQAPRTVLNVPITGSRRFAADGWDLSRIKAVGQAADATVNDVVLAMCSGALRSYLQELDALPDSSLVAMTPVSLRSADDDGAGNAVGTILCVLGTDRDGAAERLAAVRTSMNQAKANLEGLNQLQVTALSGFMVAPLMLTTAVAEASKVMRPPYNLVISNVPGPASDLYWNGSRMTGFYPMSIPTHGQALNITVSSYAGQMEFGLIGCRRTLPHLQRLLTGLDEELKALERAYGV
jgi:WS/DGAT/MGAT family acyltransferase